MFSSAWTISRLPGFHSRPSFCRDSRHLGTLWSPPLGALQIPQVFPRRICYKSASAIHSLHPGIKIGRKCQEIPRHPRVCPRGRHPVMVADTCIIVGSLSETTSKIPVSWTSQDSENDLSLELIQERPSIDGRSRELQPRTKLLRQFHQFPNICE